MRRIARFLVTVGMVACIVPALASAAGTTTIPTRHIAASGGKVTMAATVKVAGWCVWSSSPKVPKFNRSVRCNAGRVTRSGKIGANSSAKPRTYTLTMKLVAKSTVVDHMNVVEAGKPIPSAQVVVVNNGFTQSSYSVTITSETFINYGVVLQNDSQNVDALNVTVNVSFADNQGRSVASEQTTLTGIPAKGRFYLGGLTASNVSITVASMQVSLTIGSSQWAQLILPPVANITLQTDGFGDGSVSGNLTNPYSTSIPSDANIYVVYFGPGGNIVGGASEQTGAAVQPRAVVSFGFTSNSTINSSFVLASGIATIQGSVDPCSGLDIELNACPAQIPSGASA